MGKKIRTKVLRNIWIKMHLNGSLSSIGNSLSFVNWVDSETGCKFGIFDCEIVNEKNTTFLC